MTAQHKHGPAGYEKKDVHVGKVVLYAVLGIIVTVAVVAFVIDYFNRTRERIVFEAVLQPESPALRALQMREAELLGVYGVVDSAAGTYRIPIEQAMEVVVRDYQERQATP
jgi:hypothetical protein